MNDLASSPISKRASSIFDRSDNRNSALTVAITPLNTKSKNNGPKSAYGRLSYHAISPLFSHSTDHLSSPTFSISFSAVQRTGERPKSSALSPPPPLGYSASSSDLSNYSPATGDGRPQLHRAPASMPTDMPSTSAKSFDAEGNEMIDQQLEMLSQLFPNHAKTASRDIADDLQAAGIPAERKLEEQGAEGDDFDITSDYTGNDDEIDPKSNRVSQLLSDWPKLDELQADAAAPLAAEKQSSGRSSLASLPERASSNASPVRSLDAVLSPSDSGHSHGLASRRSANPNLSVDPRKTQEFKAKELELIRRLKDGNAAKQQAVKAKPETQADVPITVTETSNQVPAVAAIQVQPASEASEADIKGKGHTRRKSTDSSTSGIVWSAVVEQFSEMAAEIAAGGAQSERKSHLSTSSSDASGRLSVNSTHSTIRPAKPSSLRVGSPINEMSEEDDEDESSGLAAPATEGALLAPSHESVDTNMPRSVSSAEELASLSARSELPGFTAAPAVLPSAASSKSLTPPRAISPVQMKRRSKSFQPTSIMKNRGLKGVKTAADGTSTYVGSDGVERAWVRGKPKGRTVRVQSHHADLMSATGDFANFLKRASKHAMFADDEEADGDDPASDKHSIKSRLSGKSGIENGCFRRGSMSSIKTGKTIATIGTVKDMSRGARFRSPSALFLAASRGLTTPPRGPHQKGNPGLGIRRRGSKAKRASLEIKRGSMEGETLGAALMRMKDEKRKAPGPSIGDLLFEDPNRPYKPTSAPAPSAASKGKGRAPPQGPLPAQPAGYAASSFTPSLSAKNLALASSAPARPGYAATSFAPQSRARPGPGPASSMGVGIGSRSQQNGGFPFPGLSTQGGSQMGGHGPVQMKGFPMPGKPGYSASAIGLSQPFPGAKGPGSSLSLSASRQQILNSSSASSLSVSSTRKSPSNGARLPGGQSFAKPGLSQGNLARNNMANMATENSFISMTPARSELSAMSARSDRDIAVLSGGSSLGSGNRQHAPPLPGAPGYPSGASLPNRPPPPARSLSGGRNGSSNPQRQNSSGSSPLPPLPSAGSSAPQQQRASSSAGSSRGPPSRSNTDPLPPLPNSLPPLPMRALSNGKQQQAQLEENRMSASHRVALSVNTDAARVHAERSLKMKQMADDEARRRASQQQQQQQSQGGGQGTNRATMASRPQHQQDLHESPEVISAGGARSSSMAPDTAHSFGGGSKSLKSANSFASVAKNVFGGASSSSGNGGPKRPARTDSGLPERMARPPSVEPVEDDASDLASVTSSKKTLGKVFGFGKKKK